MYFFLNASMFTAFQNRPALIPARKKSNVSVYYIRFMVIRKVRIKKNLYSYVYAKK